MHYASIHELSRDIRARKISPLEAVEACLMRIEALNPSLNAFITLLGNEARSQAKLAEEEIKAGKWRGVLHGIPVAVKDFYDAEGVKTTAGAQPFEGRVAGADAE